ncbi:dTMP kinase [Candidatus Riesia pediculischaeffi]|uniref:Thymidylate kinase n=1 Tax=Candidatus Riesia pediculischaeffi PTSU TaxID=1401651 RepID=A0A0C1S9W2_9ENTR|nr:dTMP kinase [Candidatus Riesia pediculischaeffi]KIE64096.1 Thymidylate kinase [Candidatus Riesia pediculischaeffi PTSU]
MDNGHNFGRYIAVEGLEGSGKTTMVEVIKEILIQEGISNVSTVREPGGTPISEEIRNLMKRRHIEKISIKTELFMFYAARIQLLKNVISPYLRCGKWVIGDRCFLSSYAYQGGKNGVVDEDIDEIHRISVGRIGPDFTIYLDVFPEVGISRVRNRTYSRSDRIEGRSLDFFHGVRHRYLDSIKKLKNYMIVDANRSLNVVKDDLRIELHKFVRNHFRSEA